MKQIYKSLEEIYKNLDAELKELPQPCTSCGECCHFYRAEHRLYASKLELNYVKDHVLRPPKMPEKDVCPFLLENKCSIRGARMLGCRTYFSGHCQSEAEQANRLYEKYLKQIRELCQEHGLGWEYMDAMSFFRDRYEG